MHRFALGLAALALVLVTTACEDDPEPKIAEPTEDPTSQTTSDPPTSEPTPEPVLLSPERDGARRGSTARTTRSSATGDASSVAS